MGRCTRSTIALLPRKVPDWSIGRLVAWQSSTYVLPMDHEDIQDSGEAEGATSSLIGGLACFDPLSQNDAPGHS